MNSVQKISPYLWFDNQAEEAVNLYVSIFNNSKIENMIRYGEAGPGPAGSLMSATFELEGQRFMALNGGPHHTFSPAISFFVNCDTQQEIDRLWTKLTADGGEEGECGWLKDKFGVSWQIIPVVLGEMMQDEDMEKSQRVTKVMLQMNKLNIDQLKQAYQGY